MKNNLKTLLAFLCFASIMPLSSFAQNYDPDCVVAEWSNSSTYQKIMDINFSDETWPDTWKGETGKDCPSYWNGGYVNAILDVPVNGGSTIKYPILFHNCTFANKKSYNGFAGATAAFCRQYYLGENCTGIAATNYNNWTVTGHTKYIEDNIKYDPNGNPIYGEAGFVQMCRDLKDENGKTVDRLGWVEIDHIPYVERIQWAWSNTSWGRGIKCDIKIGDGDWKPLVWMGSDQHKSGYTMFSDQGYFMENVINAADVSLRWRIWDGETTPPVQNSVFAKIGRLTWCQAARLHKIRIFGNEISEEQAQYAKDNPIGDVGELSDLGGDTGGGSVDVTAPDANAPIVIYTVDKEGNGDFTTIQAAINNVPNGSRGLIYIRPGIYEENIYCGTKDNKNKFISLIGENKETTILTSSVDRGSSHSSNTYNDCAALNVYTSCFYAENLTIRNTSGNVGQAEALFTAGDAHIFNNCILSGYQDTYKSNVASRGYFNNCTISGATDFIYDGGLEWFENCEIVCLKGGGYITAPAESSMPMTRALHQSLSTTAFYPGLFFRNCNVTAENGVSNGAYYLGRPWKQKGGAMFITCKLGSHINAAGWKEWNGNEASSSLCEYKNITPEGNLINTSSRASFSYQATDEEVEAYMNPEFIFSKFSDVPFNYSKILLGAAAPMNFVITPTEIKWESDDNAAGYIIYKDDNFFKFTQEAKILKEADDQSVYTIATVSNQGVVSKAVKPSDAERILAFPTAEGFGKYTTGGRGGKVVKVTNLKNSGEGSLRWAFSQYQGEPITIVFEVSGEIVLSEELKVNRADWTLAGQTAPGEGIVITHNKVNFGGSQNFIVRNIRFRVGQKNTAGEINAVSAIGAENCANFIFDHCSVGWSVEETMDTQDSHFLTVQNCIVHEGLYNAGHSKGARGYGCQWGGSPATYYRNLLANNKSRSPRFNGARGEDYVVFMEYINNVNYNWGSTGACYGGENTADITSYNGLNSAHECNFINNYYKAGAACSASGSKFFSSSYARSGATSWGPAKWYVNGNIMEGNATATADNWKAVSAETYSLDDIRADERIVTSTPYYKYSVAGNIGTYDPVMYMIYDYETAEQAYESVANSVGTVNRDKVEQRIINDMRRGASTYGGSVGAGKGIIDTENDAEGFYTYSTDYVVPTDTDGDGMPDVWEQQHGLDVNIADQNKTNPQGYTALEVYLNSLMGETLSDNFTNGINNLKISRFDIKYDKARQTISVSDNAIGATLRIFDTGGNLILSKTINSSTINIPQSAPSVMLIQVEGKNLTPRMLKAVK